MTSTAATANPAAKVTNVERILLVVPFHDRIVREMERTCLHDWTVVELIRVETDAGIVGWGETLPHYTWGRVSDTERAVGQSPFQIMWDDSLGAGLQMALFDAAGKLAGVPIRNLLGQSVREWCPLSFWDHDMAPELYAREAQKAVELGYTSMKIKARPWFDMYETIRQISDATPDYFKIDMDWNDFLLHVSTAVPILRKLEEDFAKIKIFEGPINAKDVMGNKLLRSQIRTATAHHYGSVPGHVAIGEGYCDGFVIAGGISRILNDGRAAAMANMPFFLQMVGTGLTATMALHLGSILSHAQWPYVTCHELFQHPVITQRPDVVGGYAKAPDGPGLGVEVDEAAIEQYRVDEANLTLPARLVKYIRPSGVSVYFANTWEATQGMRAYFHQGNQPVFERGVTTEYLEDDGSAEFADMLERTKQGPVVTRA